MISTEFMFSSHLYTFAGKIFRQASGGPIGLRGTCAIARLVMQMWDLKWMARMDRLKVVIWLAMRYMDDGRAFKSGWRWYRGDLVFCKSWGFEDAQLSPTERTRRILHATMQDLEEFLTFTMETVEDFSNGYLPTLDTEIGVTKQNRIEYRFYEKCLCPECDCYGRKFEDEDTFK